MGSKVCMNGSCRATASPEWKRGWALVSGGFAILCHHCGSAYDNSLFCNTFHMRESGWRQCILCNKLLHCGCVASKSLIELLDYGGVCCINCERLSRLHSGQSVQIQSDIGFSKVIQHRSDILEAHNKSHHSLHQLQKGDTMASFGKIKHEENIDGFQDLSHISGGSSKFGFSGENIPAFVQTTIHAPLIRHGQIHRQILPKPSKYTLIAPLELNKNKGFSDVLPATRSHGEGRACNQLLPRYWPRITEQELQQLSGDLNSTIVPLFEKILSASDAGRIGRLVLPKACAEAYFPPISQSEGLPIRIQDVNGREWTFQFRFWPNNNSRMYVLEGVTPCIHSLQLQAGDTVTFSRIDPGGKLVMGFRKSLNSIEMQDTQRTCGFSGEPISPKDFENTSHGNRCSSLQQSRKESTDYEQTLRDEIVYCDKKDNMESLPNLEKMSRNIGSKTKRLLMHSEDALKLRVTWEEAQELLRPPPTVKPNIVIVENHEFEEYDEPPVFGKRTFFVAGLFGEQEQWSECDSCGKWRKLPVEVLLPPNWVCSENVWDLSRCSCIEPEEKRPKELDDSLSGLGEGLKKQRGAGNRRAAEECDEPLSGLYAPTTAVLGDSNKISEEATTKHPRHRSGCTCIVCIQPPSGKNKHESNCECNVCSTVKRRFKTLTMRKKMRLQSENEEAGISGSGELGHLQESDGGIDLNCDPRGEARDEERGGGGASMTSLVKAASFPLDVYLKQIGLASLVHERKTILEEDAAEGEEEEQTKDGGESNVDEECEDPRLD